LAVGLVPAGCHSKSECSGHYVHENGVPTDICVEDAPPSDAGSSADAIVDGGADARASEAPLVAATSGTTETLRGVWASGDLAVAVGDHGAIVTSNDAGKTWTLRPSGVGITLTAVWGSGPSDVFACGLLLGDGGTSPTIVHSVDAGASWTTLTYNGGLTSVWGANADEVYFGGANGVVYRTRDHGAKLDPVASVSGFGGA